MIKKWPRSHHFTTSSDPEINRAAKVYKGGPVSVNQVCNRLLLSELDYRKGDPIIVWRKWFRPGPQGGGGLLWG